MNIRHHPSDETLFRYATGILPPGPALVIATHLGFCPLCRHINRGLTSVAGRMLSEEEPEAMAAGALADTLARLDQPAPEGTRPRPNHADLPAPLAAAEIAPWRWLSPGIHIAHVGPRSKQRSVFLLRCAPGSSLPAHRHSVPEYSCVIKGSYSDANGRYSAGDLEESQADLSHAPTVDAGGECMAIIAVEGRLQLVGLLPRLLQPFFGI